MNKEAEYYGIDQLIKELNPPLPSKLLIGEFNCIGTDQLKIEDEALGLAQGHSFTIAFWLKLLPTPSTVDHLGPETIFHRGTSAVFNRNVHNFLSYAR